ncbi:Shedu anti-phage system protein SduA domain-containing protein [Seonamhaeicola marinus]|uniref:DUF4263 domain-containing protein n=1 Tax=Seonamhaeicola marinus TaxID=1912246 RepID=A0A5D0I9W0_9FLAO|nr:Shedu anti-phage system protein SduA domain-containing protein [Seonamhaeicola marinus]TYA78542.1 DUF4263 domain-containing protein [Seonamhaeicola marinus]
MLYKRNYLELSPKEKSELETAENYLLNAKSKNEIGISPLALFKYHELLPTASYFYKSLFPNNYIHFNYKMQNNDIIKDFGDFKSIVKNKNSNERDVLNFIKKSESYFILESLFFRYEFGHHDAYLFREFALPPNHLVDFLLVGKSSGGYQFIFIEFESPNKDVTLKDGSLGIGFRKGIKQIEDWDLWIDSNFFSLKQVFKKYKNPNKELPSEFYELDKTRIHYLVIAGQRTDFNENTYRLKRKGINNIKIKHYDNLIDEVNFYLETNLKERRN